MTSAPMTQQIDAMILDSDTYFVKYKIPKKIAANINNKTGLIPSITPALVATALPPLNPKYTG